MGTCKYCHQKAGFLRTSHNECKQTYSDGKKRIVDKVSSAILATDDYSDLNNKINGIAESSYVPKNELPLLLGLGLDNVVDTLLSDGIISINSEEKIESFRNHFNLQQQILNKNGSWGKIVKAAILRDLTDGKIPTSRFNIDGNLPILLQKSEHIIWGFQNVDYLEQKSKTVYRGSSQGVSIRIAKGLYYRTSSFRGNPVKVDQTDLVGSGLLLLTTHNIFFVSPAKSVKIPYKKLLVVEPYSDGISVQKDNATAKPQLFRGLDGWFAYNVVSNINTI